MAGAKIITDIIGDTLRLAGKEAPEAAAGIRAYHASPYDFDKFDLSKVGTGEGAQAFGHGMYYSDDPRISGRGGKYWTDFLRTIPNSTDREAVRTLADWNFNNDKAIANLLRRKELTITNPFEDLGDGAKIPHNIFIHNVDDEISKIDQMIQLLQSKDPLPGPRAYEVNINARPDQLLDWDKPIREQSPYVLNALNVENPKSGAVRDRVDALNAEIQRLTATKDYSYFTLEKMFEPDPVLDALILERDELSKSLNYALPLDHPMYGKTSKQIGDMEVYQLVKPYGQSHHSVAASEALAKAGIPGLHYPTGSLSGFSGDNMHRNYVVFDPTKVDIVNKFANGGRIAKAGAGAVVGDVTDALLKKMAKEAPAYPVLLNRADPATEVLRGRAAQMMLPKKDRMQPTGPQFFDTSPQAYETTLTRVPQENFMHMLPQPVYGKDLPKNNRLLPLLENFEDVASVYADKMRPFVDKNVGYFYHTGPIYNKAEELLQSDLGANEFMDRFSRTYAGASPRTATDQNLLNASLLNYRDLEGFDLGYPVLNRAGNNDVGYPMIKGMHPDLTRRLLADEPTFLNNPKPTSFAENVRGNLQGITADTHNIRGILVSYDQLFPGKLPREWFKNDKAYQAYRENGLTPAVLKGGIDDSLGSQTVGGVKRQSEYGPIAEITERSADILGVPPAMGQSLGWFGLGNMTNLKSAPKTLTEILGERINVTAQYLGESPEDVFKMYIQGKIPLMNQGGRVEKAGGGSVNDDADIEAALMTARTEKAGGGAKMLSEAFQALTSKPSREALQPLTPQGSGYIPVPGKPALVDIPFVGLVEARPIAPIEEAAAKYMERMGRPGAHVVDEFPAMDKDKAARIAVAYDEMLHDPTNPAVRRSYEAMIDETIAQYNALKDLDLDIRFNPAGFDPYAKSPSMGYADLAEHGRLWVFPTEQGYGSSEIGAVLDPESNPLLKRVGPIGEFENATANDLFRVVHDVYGHLAPGNPFFRAPGEERAWLQHSRMYSDEALPAMSSETRGQNSWVNYGPYGEFNRKASGADTIYADQKSGIMPPWTYEKAEGGAVEGALRIARAEGGAMPYGQLPSLPYDAPKPLTPFSTPAMVNRSEALRDAYRNNDDLSVELLGHYSDDAINNMATAYRMQQYIEDVTGKRPQPDEVMSSRMPTLRDELIAAMPERHKANAELAYDAASLTGLPQFAEGWNKFIRTGESPSFGEQAMMAVDMAPGVLMAAAKPIYRGLKAGYQAAKPALKKVGLPTATGVIGATAAPDEAEAGIFGEVATKLIGEEGLNLAKRMYDEGASMAEIEAATKWYAPKKMVYSSSYFDDDSMVPSIGAWRTYIDPKNAKFADRKISNVPTSLKNVLDWPEFEAAYPELMYSLNVVPYSKNTRGGYFDQGRQIIGVGDIQGDFYKPFGGNEYQNTLMHELQHAIQGRSGFSSGSSPDIAGSEYQIRAGQLGEYDLGNEIYNSPLRMGYYYANPGEIEARNVANRFANPELRSLPIEATEDVPTSVRLPTYGAKANLADILRVKDWWNTPEGQALMEGKPILNKDRP